MNGGSCGSIVPQLILCTHRAVYGSRREVFLIVFDKGEKN